MICGITYPLKLLILQHEGASHTITLPFVICHMWIWRDQCKWNDIKYLYYMLSIHTCWRSLKVRTCVYSRLTSCRKFAQALLVLLRCISSGSRVRSSEFRSWFSLYWVGDLEQVMSTFCTLVSSSTRGHITNTYFIPTYLLRNLRGLTPTSYLPLKKHWAQCLAHSKYSINMRDYELILLAYQRIYYFTPLFYNHDVCHWATRLEAPLEMGFMTHLTLHLQWNSWHMVGV